MNNRFLHFSISRTAILAAMLLALGLIAASAHAQEHRRHAPSTQPIPATAANQPSPSAPPAATAAQAAKAAKSLRSNVVSGEQFFIITSVDPAKRQLVLKRPTEVTQVVSVDDKTSYLDESGKPLKLADLRAGDTVFVLSSTSADPVPLATRIRRGPMTLAELHKHYLNY